MSASLAQIVHVPMDVFAEIVSHLKPIDMLSLARTTKHFRKLVMSRSAKHMWRAAERNVPGLPSCPNHIDEPKYAELVFEEQCSACGIAVAHRMIGPLAVKLCLDCEEECLVTFIHVPIQIKPLVLCAITTDVQPFFASGCSLIDEVNLVVDMIHQYATAGDSAGFEQWKLQRMNEMIKRRAFSNALALFFDNMDQQETDRIEKIRTERSNEIEARLMELGWEEDDCNNMCYPWLVEWNRLVGHPEPLTNEAWERLLPRLLPLLRANQQYRLEAQRRFLRNLRISRVREYLAQHYEAFPQLIELGSEYSQPSDSPATIALPFPNLKAALEMTSIKDILHENILEGGVEDFFENPEQLLMDISNWRYSLETDLGKLVDLVGNGGGYMNILMPNSLRPCDERDSTTTEFTEQSLAYIQQSTRKLLRADSVFRLPETDECYFYPEIIHIVQARLDITADPDLIYHESDDREDGDYDSNGLRKSLDLSAVSGHATGRRAAKRLLRCLGKPHAAYLEMQAIGERFVCGRCWMKKPMNWDDMVEHYVNSEATSALRYYWHLTHGIKFNIEHDTKEDQAKFEAEEKIQMWKNYRQAVPRIDGSLVEPESPSKPTKPLVRMLTKEEAEQVPTETLLLPIVKCRICESIVNREEGLAQRSMPIPNGSRETVIEHLVDVHELTEGEWENALNSN